MLCHDCAVTLKRYSVLYTSDWSPKMSIAPPLSLNSRSVIDTIYYRLANDTRYILNEEATKTHLILPFIQGILGYSTPENLRPEDCADIGTRNQKKVDYACYGPNNDLRLVIECKALNVTLDEQHATQLQEYFAYTTSQIGILTNGAEWRFYIGEGDRTARMSTIPFLQFDIRDITTKDIAIVHMMSLDEYDYETIASLKQLISAYQLLNFSPDQIDQLITNAIETKHPSLIQRKRTSSGRKKQSVKDFGNIADLIDAGLLSVSEQLHISKREITEKNQGMEHPIGTFSDDYVATIVSSSGMMECNGIRTTSPAKLLSNLIHTSTSRGYTYMYVVRDGKEIPLQYLRMRYKESRGN